MVRSNRRMDNRMRKIEPFDTAIDCTVFNSRCNAVRAIYRSLKFFGFTNLNFSEWSEFWFEFINQVIFHLTKFTAFGSISLLRVSNYLYYLSLSKWLVNYYNRVFNNLDHPIVRAQFNHLITQFNASVPPDVKISSFGLSNVVMPF